MLEGDLGAVRADIDVVNIQRRRRQEEVRGEVEALDKGWREGVGRVLETEIAVEELRKQIRQELKRRTTLDA
jgi:pre-mRNA-splicing factor SPF27